LQSIIEGKVKVKIEGKAESTWEIATKLLRENLAPDFVARVMGLKIDELNNISRRELV
jgi:hypothetical protein